MKSSEISYVKLLTEQNFDFFRKKKHFLSFDFFWILKFFSGKECLPAVCRHIAGKLLKKFFGKKIEKLKTFHEFVFFSNESFFSKNLT